MDDSRDLPSRIDSVDRKTEPRTACTMGFVTPVGRDKGDLGVIGLHAGDGVTWCPVAPAAKVRPSAGDTIETVDASGVFIVVEKWNSADGISKSGGRAVASEGYSTLHVRGADIPARMSSAEQGIM